MARRGRVKVGPSAAPQIGEDLEDVLVDAREMADDDEAAIAPVLERCKLHGCCFLLSYFGSRCFGSKCFFRPLQQSM